MLRAVIQKRQTFVRGFCASAGGGGGVQLPTRWGEIFKLVTKKWVYERTISSCGRSHVLVRFMEWTKRSKTNWVDWVNKVEPISGPCEEFAATYTSAMLWLVFGIGSTGKLLWDWHLNLMTGKDIQELRKLYKFLDGIGRKHRDDMKRNYQSTQRKILTLRITCMVHSQELRAVKKDMAMLKNNVEALKKN